MATYTTNYSLEKPASTDLYNISVFNDNADAIDTAIHNNATDIASKAAKAWTLLDDNGANVNVDVALPDSYNEMLLLVNISGYKFSVPIPVPGYTGTFNVGYYESAANCCLATVVLTATKATMTRATFAGADYAAKLYLYYR